MHSREVQREQVQRGLEMVNNGMTYRDASITVRGNESMIPSLERARRAAAGRQLKALVRVEKVILQDGYELCDVCGEVMENGELCTRLKLVDGYCKYGHCECLKAELPALWKKALSTSDTLELLEHAQCEYQVRESDFDDDDNDLIDVDI